MTITIDREQYDEYVRLKDRVNQVKKIIDREKYISDERLRDIFDFEPYKSKSKKESEEK